jgi:hypothetical protein
MDCQAHDDDPGFNILKPKYKRDPETLIKDSLQHSDGDQILYLAYTGWKYFGWDVQAQRLLSLLPQYGFQQVVDRIRSERLDNLFNIASDYATNPDMK